MATLNPITHRLFIRTGTPNRISRIPIHTLGLTQHIAMKNVTAPAIEEVELQ